ncbi:glutathione S-transferase N-terminal domain-containing protein [bacterium]|nr:glutathione S-transferase N-terminal domain-containing protein [bacterium]
MKNVEIYTLAYCPYCQKAKFFLKDHNIEYTEIHCDDDEEEKRQELTKKFNLKSLATFPQIVIDGVNIGGYSDLIQKHSSGEISF